VKVKVFKVLLNKEADRTFSHVSLDSYIYIDILEKE